MARDNDYISAKVRSLIAERAGYGCEYCLINEIRNGLACEVDYIVGIKHSGQTELINLAYACFNCNRNIGSDIGSIHWPTNQYIRFFNPRTDLWSEHFRFEKQYIVASTDIGWVTERIFRFNDVKRLSERSPFS